MRTGWGWDRDRDGVTTGHKHILTSSHGKVTRGVAMKRCGQLSMKLGDAAQTVKPQWPLSWRSQ